MTTDLKRLSANRWATCGLTLLLALAFILTPSAPLQAQATQDLHGGTGGLWLPVNLKKYNAEDMQAMGLQLPVDSLYHPEARDLSEAVVRLNDGSCTAEAVSAQGLIFTNHHCAFDMVAALSSEENDLLTQGFWAASQDEEIPLEGATASFLIRSEDVTEQVLAAGADQVDDAIQQIESALANQLMSEGAAEGQYQVEVKPVFHGSEYYLFVYETFRDIRLAGIPPVAIGKYGYDQDNWVWPRHTGDFAVLRVYANADNAPADYDASNPPYRPRHYFPVSLAGVEPGDFTMTVGYPGSTERYLTSHAIEQELAQNNPDRIELMGDVATIMEQAMEANNTQRIALEARYAGLMNAYKYYIGQTKMLKRYDIVAKKQRAEAAFQTWVDQEPKRQEPWGDLLTEMEAAYTQLAPHERVYTHLVYSVAHPDVAPQGVFFSYAELGKMAQALRSRQEAAIAAATEEIRSVAEEHFEGLFPAVDQEMFVATFLNLYENLPEEAHPSIFAEIASGRLSDPGAEAAPSEDAAPAEEPKREKRRRRKRRRQKGEAAPVAGTTKSNLEALSLEERVQRWATQAYAMALSAHPDSLAAFLAAPEAQRLQADPLYRFGRDMIQLYVMRVAQPYNRLSQQLEGLQQQYLAALREMYPEKNFYPDANSTMRFSYGTVQPYEPRDAVVYQHYTTLEGMMEKEDAAPEDPDYEVPPKLRDLYEAQSYGPYGDEELVTCFINTCETSGGSSGSPVLNSRGELVGIAFDGNWEAMTGDIDFEPEIQRTISVDIRYILFVIDKFAEARHLIDEMKIVR